jgi:pimeloyl-ACP methyl ester carboxylesterase
MMTRYCGSCMIVDLIAKNVFPNSVARQSNFRLALLFLKNNTESVSMNILKRKITIGLKRGLPVDIYHEIHSHVSGSGKEKLLFITGWAGSCENWKYQTEFFGKLKDFEVCIYENRGSGFSSTQSLPASNYQMTDMAADANELISHLGWDNQKIHVVGVSMGGMIAQHLALMRPTQVKSLCLASTHAGGRFPPAKHIPFLASTFTKVVLGLDKVQRYIPKILYSNNWLMNPAPKNSGCKNNYEYMLKFHESRIDSRPPQCIKSAIYQLWGILCHYVSPDKLRQLGQQFKELSIPTLVIHGTEDVLVRKDDALELAEHLNSKLVVFDGKGHALNHEDIDSFNELLLQHFQSANVTSSAPELSSMNA